MKGRELVAHLEQTARKLPKADEDGKKLRRCVAALRNLSAIGTRHDRIASLVNELLSQKVGQYRTILEDNCDELSDPADNDEVEALAAALGTAQDTGCPVWIARLGGREIGLKGLLTGAGINRVVLGGPVPSNAVVIRGTECESLGIALGVFKALQLLRSRDFRDRFRDYTAIDIEATDKDVNTAEPVSIAAVRVRDGKRVDEYHSLVKPSVESHPEALAVHGLKESDLEDARSFAEVWPEFRKFCGSDLLVAHNGHGFDFPVLRRMAGEADWAGVSVYDTLVLARELRTGSAKLENLARIYGIDAGRAHEALSDTRALAEIFMRLGEDKLRRARKTSLDSILDHLGIALALSNDESLNEEALRVKGFARFYSLGKYTHCLDFYQSESDAAADPSIASLESLIVALGGEDLRLKLRREKTADERYPEAMLRLQPLLAMRDGMSLREQIISLLEKITLSRWDGTEPEGARVNLLTLHSTKGLEFSRVYVIGTDNKGFTRDEKKPQVEIEELRRLLYVGMTRTKERLVLTCAETRGGENCGGHQFLDELELTPVMTT
jgi:DNA polymerase III epsilon subunit-like protein